MVWIGGLWAITLGPTLFRIPVTGAGIGVIVNQAMVLYILRLWANLGSNKGYMRFSPDGTRLP